MNDGRGFYRIFIRGIGFLELAFFVAVNKYVETRKPLWIPIFVGLFTLIVFHLTRQYIIFAFLVAVGYLLKTTRLWIWLCIVAVFLVFIPNKSKLEPDKDTIIGTLYYLTESQIEDQQSGNTNTRLEEYVFYFTEYSKNFFTNLFGNGFPRKESALGVEEALQRQLKGLFWEDVGYAAIFIRIGLTGLILFCYIFYRIATKQVSVNYMYAKLFMIYFIFINIGSSKVFYSIIEMCVCLYILEYDKLNRENLNKALNLNDG
ncbi:MAG: hypothetical protein LBG92_03380 [Prevotellaceae bacterium]|jgi:hypothetical protein|nr:hypothetical protein [Prevotellaceae bacterium]